MVTNLIDLLAKIVVSTIGFLGYGGIFFLMLLESCGVPMPSEVIMPFSGFLAVSGQLHLSLIILFGTLGDVAGASLAYWIGYKGGRPLVEKYGKAVLLSSHDLDLADRWFKKYGQLTVFFGRILPVVRTYISFPAGIAKMNFKKFITFTFLGALPWCALLAWLGVKMGDNWELIRTKMHSFDTAMAIVIIILIILYIWRHLKLKAKSE